MNTKKLLSLVLCLCLMIQIIAPASLVRAEESSDVKTPPLQSLPAFPEDTQTAKKDWSETNWDEYTVLPEDKASYEKEYKALMEAGKMSEAQALKPTLTPSYTQKSLEFYRVPSEVQKMVSTSYQNNGLMSVDKKQALKEQIKAWQNNQTFSAQSLETPDSIASETSEMIVNQKEETPLREISKNEFKKLKNEKLTPTASLEIHSGKAEEKSLLTDSKNSSLQSTLPNLMETYEGIQKNNVDFGLLSLTKLQNEDGSIGTSRVSQNTFEFLEMLKYISRTQTLEYQKAQNYFLNLSPQNTLELIYKARVMNEKGLNISGELAMLEESTNPDGGVALLEGYQSDMLTTLEAGNLYRELNNTTKITQILNFLVPKIPANGEMKYSNSSLSPSSLLTYKTWKFLSKIEFSDKVAQIAKLSSFLENIPDGNNTLRVAVSGKYFEETIDTENAQFFKGVLKSRQKSNGLFTDVLSSIIVLGYLAEARLQIIDFVPTATPVHDRAFSGNLVMKNTGYKTSYTPEIFLYANKHNKYDGSLAAIQAFPANTQLTLPINFVNTNSWKANTSFDFYIDGAQDESKENNWYTKSITFGNNPENTPKMPEFFVASSHQISGENPYGFNIRWSDTNKDSNLKNYVILLRKNGTTSWEQYPLSPTENGAFLHGLNIGDTYDISVGVISTLDPNSVYYFQNPVTVTVEANDTQSYFSLKGSVIENQVGIGLNLMSYGGWYKSDEIGDFESDIKLGRNVVRIDDVRYEKFSTNIVGNTKDQQLTTRLHTRLKYDDTRPVIGKLQFSGDFVLSDTLKRDIYVQGNDDIGIKKIELFYLDPLSNIWMYITTLSLPLGNNYAKYTWDMGTLSGNGYKLKAVAYDYFGNISPEFVTPAFSIANDLLVNVPQTSLKLGDSLNISIQNRTDKVYSTLDTAYLVSGTTLKTVKRYVSKASDTSFLFSIPYRSEYIGNDQHLELILCNTTDNMCLTVQTPKINIQNIAFTTPSPWIDKGEINFSLTNGDYNRNIHHVGVKENGGFEVIYSDYNKYTSRDYQLIYRKFENGAWLTPVVLKTLYEISGDNFERLEDLKITTSGNKIALTYYHLTKTTSISYNQAYDNCEVYAILIENGAKKWEKRVSQDTTFSSGNEAIFDANNTLHVFWYEGYSWNTSSGVKSVKTITYKLDGSAGPLQVITNSYSGTPKGHLIQGTLYLALLTGNEKYRWRTYDPISKTWNDGVDMFQNQIMFQHKVFISDGADGDKIYDIFYLKYDSSNSELSNYQIYHKRLSILGSSVQELFTKKLTSYDSESEIANWFVIKTPSGFSFIVEKRMFGSYTHTSELRHIVYQNSQVNKDELLIPATTSLTTNQVYMSQIGNEVYPIFMASVGNNKVLKYLSGDISQTSNDGGNGEGTIPPPTSDFIFPSLNIKLERAVDKFGITFQIEKFKFTLWIDYV